MVIQRSKQTGKVKKLNKWVPHEFTKTSFWMSSSLIPCNSKPFFDWILMCDEKWILHDNWQGCQGPAQWLNSEKLQSTSQSQTCTKKMSWSPAGGLLPLWSTTAFWILGNPLHLRSMLSKLMRCIKNCNYCSQHWSTERAQFFSTTTINQCFKSWTNWATEFWLIGHIHLTSHQPSITSSRILTTFCSKNASTTSRKEKMLSKTS